MFTQERFNFNVLSVTLEKASSNEGSSIQHRCKSTPHQSDAIKFSMSLWVINEENKSTENERRKEEYSEE